MACNECQDDRNFVVHLLDAESAQWGLCVVQSPCSHDMQEWVTQMAGADGLTVQGDDGPVRMLQPTVVLVEDKGPVRVS